MVHAALFISPNSSCETGRIFVFKCMCISISYYYSKYEFLGPDSDLGSYRFRSVSSSSLWNVSTEFSMGTGLPGIGCTLAQYEMVARLLYSTGANKKVVDPKLTHSATGPHLEAAC